jgi:hypothetical protein
MKVLKAGLSSSSDNGVLAVFTDWLTPLLGSHPSRNDREFANLLSHVSEGGQMAVPTKGGSVSLLQPSFSFVSTTSLESLDRALMGGTACDRLLEGAILVRGESRPSVYLENLDTVTNDWRKRLEFFLEARKELPKTPKQPSSSFRLEVAKWNALMNRLSTAEFAPVRRHLHVLLNLPLKIAGLFMRIPGFDGGDEEQVAKAFEICKWLSVHLFIMAHHTRRAEGVHEKREILGEHRELVATSIQCLATLPPNEAQPCSIFHNVPEDFPCEHFPESIRGLIIAISLRYAVNPSVVGAAVLVASAAALGPYIVIDTWTPRRTPATFNFLLIGENSSRLQGALDSVFCPLIREVEDRRMAAYGRKKEIEEQFNSTTRGGTMRSVGPRRRRSESNRGDAIRCFGRNFYWSP